jgi:hypothetical protein
MDPSISYDREPRTVCRGPLEGAKIRKLTRASLRKSMLSANNDPELMVRAMAPLTNARRRPPEAFVTTGGIIDRELLTQTVAVLQKPYREADLVKVLAMVR